MQLRFANVVRAQTQRHPNSRRANARFSNLLGFCLAQPHAPLMRVTAFALILSLTGLLCAYLNFGSELLGVLLKTVLINFQPQSGPAGLPYDSLPIADTSVQLLTLVVFALFLLLPWIRFSMHGLARPGLIGLVLVAFILVLCLRHSWIFGDRGAALAFMFAGEGTRISVTMVLDVLLYTVFALAAASGVYCLFGEKQLTGGGLATRTGLFAAAHLAAGALVTFVMLAWSAQASLISSDPFTLIYVALPEALHSIPQGRFYLSCFYVLTCLLCWSTAMYLTAPLVTYVSERTGMSLKMAGLLVVLVILLFALYFTFLQGSLLQLTAFQWLNFLLAAMILPASLGLLLTSMLWTAPPGSQSSRFGLSALIGLSVVFAMLAAGHASQRLCKVDGSDLLVMCAEPMGTQVHESDAASIPKRAPSDAGPDTLSNELGKPAESDVEAVLDSEAGASSEPGDETAAGLPPDTATAAEDEEAQPRSEDATLSTPGPSIKSLENGQDTQQP
ncbi:hypothetical protein GCM10022278_35000 [Allohahella marinimesophila]|uniref:Uncharacterized protein n=1 Tax=Allohahella marinimesophila TaxID=1054972 RepID=A0ABP7Q214_9GAMM